MVLTKSELIASLQNEVRILLHLAAKVDHAMIDYRPSPRQRSTIELLKYLSMMGPALVRFGKGEPFDERTWSSATEKANARNFDQTVAAIAEHHDLYAALLGDMPDHAFREEMTGFDGAKTTRGSFIVNLVLSGCAAYRTQLFLYLKACGREELGTPNLWRGVDPRPAAVQ